MKKRYLLLIPVVACIVLSAAAIGYIQFHPDRAPAGAEFLVRTSNDAEQQTKEPEKEAEAQPLTASQKRANELLDAMTLEQKLYQMMFVTPEALTATKPGCSRRHGDTGSDRKASGWRCAVHKTELAGKSANQGYAEQYPELCRGI